MRRGWRRSWREDKRLAKKKKPATGSGEFVLAARNLLKSKKREYLKGYSVGTGTSAEKMNRVRFANERVHELKKQLFPPKRLRLPKALLIAHYADSPVLDAVLPNRNSLWKPVRSRDASQTIELNLENFSFIHNPVGTLDYFRKLAEIECTGITGKLHFRDKFCMDIGPYLVLSEIWPRLAPLFTGGHMEPAVQKVMEAVGLRRLMNMRLKDTEGMKNVWAFPVRQRRPFGAAKSQFQLLEPQRDQHVADDFCDEIDKWLAVAANLELSVNGRAWISGILLELLDNAERHSDPVNKDGHWSVAGCMVRESSATGSQTYRCMIGILSVGASIHESLQTCTPQTETELTIYADRHAKRQLSRETLRTLYALQDGVTRDPEADNANRGGFGFQEVLSMVETLGSTDNSERLPRLSIISGKSCVLLRHPYVTGTRMAGPQSPRVLWFNSANSAEAAPDPLHVFDLAQRFAGTIISIAFTVEAEYLRQRAHARNQPKRSNA